MAILHFEIGPDNVTTDAANDRTRGDVYFGLVGSVSLLGSYVSDPETGNDGIREWKSFSVAVSHDPSADYIVEFDYNSGGVYLDTLHIRNVYLTGDDGIVRNPEYPKGKVYTESQKMGTGLIQEQMGQDDGGSLVGAVMYDPCIRDQSSGGTRSFWYFSSAPIDPCPNLIRLPLRQRQKLVNVPRMRQRVR